MQIELLIGIPQNSQTVIKCSQASATILKIRAQFKEKKRTQKYTSKAEGRYTPLPPLNVLTWLNFLQISSSSKLPVVHHQRPFTSAMQMLLDLWCDVVTQKWKSPDPLLTVGRGFACIFPEFEPQSTWVPVHNIKPWMPPTGTRELQNLVPKDPSL